jgi:shikimate kinase
MQPLQQLQPSKTIVLVGLMGCGKSTIGRRLAKCLKMRFIDLDEHIENTVKMSITEIFTKYGEHAFRDMELGEIKQILDSEPIILATGGGAFINDEIRKLIKNSAVSVWISADLSTLLERVSRRNTRPLLENGNKEEIMRQLMQKRYPIYQQADIEVNSGQGSHDVVVRKIIEALNGQN